MIERSTHSALKGDPFAAVAPGILQFQCGSFPQYFSNIKSVSEKGLLKWKNHHDDEVYP